MKIAAFVGEETLVLQWLNEQQRALDDIGVFLSYWLHEKSLGFGLVIVDEKSGEFHLGQNGDVTFHIEQFNREKDDFEVITSSCSQTTDFHEFEKLYSEFRQGVVS